MRNIPAPIMELLKNGARFVYCFKFIHNERSFYLTSNDSLVVVDDVTYQPYSGLSLEKSIFNDSAQNYAKINGIFEEAGIKTEDDLSGCAAEIVMYFPEERAKYLLLLNYFCSKIVRDGLKFTMYLHPFADKMQQTLLDYFSTTCRAQFGDHKCRADKNIYPAGTYCDKSFRTCCNKFNNAVNFCGEPFIPGAV